MIDAEQKYSQQEENKDLNVFLDAIDLYLSKPAEVDNLSENIRESLQVLMQLPSSKWVSLFLLNEANFEFELRNTFPLKFNDDSQSVFDFLINTNSIGKSLQSGDVTITPNSEENSEIKDFIIIPLVVSWGILGLVIIANHSHSDDLSRMLIRLCSFHGKVFANSLERSYLFLKLKNQQSELEQKVAVRTMDLAQSKHELKAILDSVQTGILVIDTEKDLIFKANPIAAELIGFDYLDISEKKASKYLDTVDLKGAYKATNYESTLKTINGDEIPIIRTTSQIFLNGTNYNIESFIDIKERKMYEIALQEANIHLEKKVKERTEDLEILVNKLKIEIVEREQAESEAKRLLTKEKELSEMKTKFVSMVSHEFRTPLTVIKSAAQFMDLYSNKLPQEVLFDYIKRIISTVDFMTDLVENILFIGKSEHSTSKQVTSTVDIINLTLNLINEIQFSTAKKRYINFSHTGTAKREKIDEKLLKLALSNILSNAIKYSPENSQIDVSLLFEEDFIQFTIKDYGIGIPAEDKDKVFEIFHRSNNVGDVSGTGLGLGVVLQALSMMKGSIDFESEINQGTTFYIKIPK